MATTPHPTARGLLVWMQTHLGRLRELLDREAEGQDDLAPAGAPALLADRLDRVDEEIRRGGEAVAFELDLQFCGETADDTSVRAMVDRRLRIGAWTRVFLAELDAARAPAPPVADQVLAWMGERQTQLADTIFAMDRRAKEAELSRGGPDAIADAAVVNRIGQAAMLQAHTRFLVEALAEAV